MPVVNIDKLIKEELGSRRKRAPDEDDWDFSEFETETLVENEDMSVTKYPAPYCDQVQHPCMSADGHVEDPIFLVIYKSYNFTTFYDIPALGFSCDWCG